MQRHNAHKNPHINTLQGDVVPANADPRPILLGVSVDATSPPVYDLAVARTTRDGGDGTVKAVDVVQVQVGLYR